MKILFTGASSFTGYWFVRELARAGHDVVAVYRRTADEYEGVRRQRIDLAASLCTQIWECSFGDDKFLELIATQDWGMLCHHAADVTDYKSPDFDVTAAVENNTRNLGKVLDNLQKSACNRVLLTGSVFEYNEGAGDRPLRAFSPYGLSKGLTAEMFAYHCAIRGMHLGKFVIPNPFGPYEEPRFTAYLMRTWFEKKTAGVNTPAYVRDNIHVSLLARAYSDFAQNLGAESGFSKLNPCGYIETQGAFARRFASEMSQRLGIACELDLAHQTEFMEPRVRINTDMPDHQKLDWDETAAWDEVAEYYRR
ncbi:MAG TPA: NAD(P)-dependent oxidoreductase [Bacteroidetes bacterium]|nr:NAD(P)-dependent oxidoreductase [Bacteroidota bacterium]